MYQIKFTLGDFSRDGHGQFDNYIVESNKPVQHLRELHFSCIDILGFDIGDICKDYGDNSLSEYIYNILVRHQIFSEEDVKNFEECFEAEDAYLIDGPNELIHIWLNILKYLDPELTTHIKTPDEIPSMHFYGYDKKKRHLNNPGYGLYDI